MFRRMGYLDAWIVLSRDLLSTSRGCIRPQRGQHREKRQIDKALTPNKPEGPQELDFRNEATHREALHGRDAAGVFSPPLCDGAGRNLSPISSGKQTTAGCRVWSQRKTAAFQKTFFFFFELHWVLVAAFRFFSLGMWELLLWPGIKSGPPAMGAWSLSHWTVREVPRPFLKTKLKKKI